MRAFRIVDGAFSCRGPRASRHPSLLILEQPRRKSFFWSCDHTKVCFLLNCCNMSDAGCPSAEIKDSNQRKLCLGSFCWSIINPDVAVLIYLLFPSCFVVVVVVFSKGPFKFQHLRSKESISKVHFYFSCFFFSVIEAGHWPFSLYSFYKEI